MTPLNERDLVILNAYLDDELTPGERAAFEQRLAVEPALQQELDAIRMTVSVLKLAERVRAPRNFTLDPATYGLPAKRSWLDRLGFIGLPQLAAVGGTLAAALICAGLVIYGVSGGLGAPLAENVAMQEPAATEEPLAFDTAQGAIEEAEETEAPEEPEAEATEEAADEGFDVATPEPDFGMTGSGGGGAGGPGGGGTGSAGVAPTATSGEVVALTLQATLAASDRSSGTSIAEFAPPSASGGEAETTMIEPTEQPVVDDATKQAPSTTIPVVPIAIIVLVIALVAGGVLARRARRR